MQQSRERRKGEATHLPWQRAKRGQEPGEVLQRGGEVAQDGALAQVVEACSRGRDVESQVHECACQGIHPLVNPLVADAVESHW